MEEQSQQKQPEQEAKQEETKLLTESKDGSTKIAEKNIWMYLTFVFLVIAVIASIFAANAQGPNPGDSTPTGALVLPADTVSGGKAAQKTIDYLNAAILEEQGVEAVVKSVMEENWLYTVEIEIKQEGETIEAITLYTTKDAKKCFLAGQVFDLEEEIEPVEPPKPQEFSKAEKPTVEVFVMSHCPYGTKMEKGIVPVAKLLGEKIDFRIRFVFYAMHGETEVNEQAKQYCMQEEQKEKFLGYMECFLEDGNTERCLEETGIDVQNLEACLEIADQEFNISKNLEDEASWLSGYYPLFDVDKELNEQYAVEGSPALFINGEKANIFGDMDGLEKIGWDPASLLEAVCSAFSEAPEECQQGLSTAIPASGFGYSGGTDSGEGSCS